MMKGDLLFEGCISVQVENCMRKPRAQSLLIEGSENCSLFRCSCFTAVYKCPYLIIVFKQETKEQGITKKKSNKRTIILLSFSQSPCLNECTTSITRPSCRPLNNHTRLEDEPCGRQAQCIHWSHFCPCPPTSAPTPLALHAHDHRHRMIFPFAEGLRVI